MEFVKVQAGVYDAIKSTTGFVVGRVEKNGAKWEVSFGYVNDHGDYRCDREVGKESTLAAGKELFERAFNRNYDEELKAAGFVEMFGFALYGHEKYGAFCIDRNAIDSNSPTMPILRNGMTDSEYWTFKSGVDELVAYLDEKVASGDFVDLAAARQEAEQAKEMCECGEHELPDNRDVCDSCLKRIEQECEVYARNTETATVKDQAGCEKCGNAVSVCGTVELCDDCLLNELGVDAEATAATGEVVATIENSTAPICPVRQAVLQNHFRTKRQKKRQAKKAAKRAEWAARKEVQA